MHCSGRLSTSESSRGSSCKLSGLSTADCPLFAGSVLGAAVVRIVSHAGRCWRPGGSDQTCPRTIFAAVLAGQPASAAGLVDIVAIDFCHEFCPDLLWDQVFPLAAICPKKSAVVSKAPNLTGFSFKSKYSKL